MFKSWMWKQRSFREQHMGDEANGGAGGSGEAQVDAGAGVDEGAGENGGQDGETQASGESSGVDGSANGSEDEEVVITLGDEAPPNEEDEQLRAAPAWVKELRKSDREKAKRIRELEQQVAASKQAQQPQQIQVGTKPTLESCEYDEARFETELTAWHDRKRQADEQASKQKKEQEDAQAAYQARLTSYHAAKTTLKVPDFDDAEAVVLGTLSEQQQGIIVHGADNPAGLIYALGKNPSKAKELASIKDPVKYAFAVAKLETQLKVTPRKAAPAPERKVSGSAGGATGMDNQLERLRAEADRTGDRSKVAAYLRQQQRAA